MLNPLYSEQCIMYTESWCGKNGKPELEISFTYLAGSAEIPLWK